jgi:hypothetical protein
MPPAPARRAPSARARRATLNLVLTVGIVDGLLLVVLLYFAFVNRDDGAVSVLGPIHGLGYVYLLYLTATGAMRGTWGWGYFGLVAVTLGPAGAIFGARRMRAEPGEEIDPGARPTRKEQRKAAAERRRER